MKKSGVLSVAMDIALPVLFGVVFVALWEAKVFHALLNVKVLQLPLPSRIMAVFMENTGKLVPDAIITLQTALSGLVIGFLSRVSRRRRRDFFSPLGLRRAHRPFGLQRDSGGRPFADHERLVLERLGVEDRGRLDRVDGRHGG